MVKIYIETKKKDQGAGYGVIMETIVKGAPVTRALHGEVAASEEKAVLEAIRAALMRMQKKSEIEVIQPEWYKFAKDLQDLDQLRMDGYWKGMRKARHHKELQKIWILKQGHLISFEHRKNPYKHWIFSNLLNFEEEKANSNKTK